MKRINSHNINTPELSDGIFHTKWHDDVHTVDMPRFQMLADRFKGGKYLDVGCFNSPMPSILAENKDNEVWAIDHAPNVIKTLKERFLKVNYVCMDFKKLPFRDEYFDYIVAGEVIEHLEDPVSFVNEMYRMLKPGGTLAISTPFEEIISRPLVSEEHLWGYTEGDLRGLLESFQVIETAVIESGCLILAAYARK